MTGPLAYVPTLQPGETLSSLLLRLARNHSATSHEFCTLVWPDLQFWTRDIDRTASDALLGEVSRVTGIARDVLERATLRDLVQATGFVPRVWGWRQGVLPVGVRHRIRHRFGQQYCSVCLAEKPPYLRRLWRMEFAVACLRHCTLLRDACPKCDAPFIPHRHSALVELRCHRCGSSLVACTTGSAPEGAAELQLRIFGALADLLPDAAEAIWHAGAAAAAQPILADIAPKEFFDGVRRLCRLAARKSGVLHEHRGHLTWALLRVGERAAIMAVVWRWLADWPNAWIEWARVADSTAHMVDLDYGPWPDWTKSAIGALPYSHGPTNVRRRRQKITFSKLRKDHHPLSAYREARAALLLRKAGLLSTGIR